MMRLLFSLTLLIVNCVCVLAAATGHLTWWIGGLNLAAALVTTINLMESKP